MSTAKDKRTTNKEMNLAEIEVKLLEVNGVIKALKALNVGEKTDFLITCGTKRKTLATIEEARINEIFNKEGIKFTFGKIIRNSQNEFVGMKVLRVQ